MLVRVRIAKCVPGGCASFLATRNTNSSLAAFTHIKNNGCPRDHVPPRVSFLVSDAEYFSRVHVRLDFFCDGCLPGLLQIEFFAPSQSSMSSLALEANHSMRKRRWFVRTQFLDAGVAQSPTMARNFLLPVGYVPLHFCAGVCHRTFPRG